MDTLPLIVGTVAGTLVGWSMRAARSSAVIGSLRERTIRLDEALEQERRGAVEREQLLAEASRHLSDTFKALSHEALTTNSTAFLELAEQSLRRERDGVAGQLKERQQAIDNLVKPVREKLERFDVKIDALEKDRVGSYAALRQQIDSLHQTGMQLRGETAQLVQALRAPSSRGRWGEMHLRRAVELAGMRDRCDFFEQQVGDTDAGRLRPDMVVQLPAGRSIVVDAKVPLEAYIDALDATDTDERTRHLDRHARHVRDHVKALSQKAYWEQFHDAPEFVVLFLPGDHFLSAALERDPMLHEDAVRQRVHIATPTTLIPLLQIVAHGWRNEALAENAREISTLGAELYKRIADLSSHWTRLGKHLTNAVDSYNGAVGSLESRVLVSARRFRDLEAAPAGADIDAMVPVTNATRSLQYPELTDVTVASDRGVLHPDHDMVGGFNWSSQHRGPG